MKALRGRPVKEAPDPLPEDLSELDSRELESARTARDERVTKLFRRWPKLGKSEQGELRRLYGERVRLAKYVGRLRRGKQPPRR